MAVSKSSSPSASPEHPAFALSAFSAEQKAALAKVQPVRLPNEVDRIANNPQHPIHRLRRLWQYVYVVSWLYHSRGFVRLLSDHFDADLFEIELLDLVQPPPLDEANLFVNRLRVALLSAVQGSKCLLNNFEAIFRIWFGSATPLGGPNEEEEEKEDTQQDFTEYPRFSGLLLEDKIDVLRLMIEYISEAPAYRTWIDKNDFTLDALRPHTVASRKVANTTEATLWMFDNTRIYKRTVTYPQLAIPKRRKLSPADPETHYAEAQFDIENCQFELVANGIYQIDQYVKELKRLKASNKRAELEILQTPQAKDTLLQAEIKKRKLLSSRKKELLLANLLATRKRSSRLEAKEKQRQDELRLARAQEEEEVRIAAERRLERRRLARNEANVGEGLTREERRLRREHPRERSVEHTAGEQGQQSQLAALSQQPALSHPLPALTQPPLPAPSQHALEQPTAQVHSPLATGIIEPIPVAPSAPAFEVITDVAASPEQVTLNQPIDNPAQLTQ